MRGHPNTTSVFAMLPFKISSRYFENFLSISLLGITSFKNIWVGMVVQACERKGVGIVRRRLERPPL